MSEHFPKSADAIITRHSIKGSGSEYPHLTPEGVEKAKERAKDFVRIIEDSEPGTVVFFGGTSYEQRTTSTIGVYADETKELLAHRPDILFFGCDEIAEESKEGYLSTAHSIQAEAEAHPDAKVVVDFPLVLKDIEKREWFYEADGQTVKSEWMDMFDRHDHDYSAAIREWFTNQGVFNGEQRVPAPAEVAESYLNGICRLEAFVKKFSGDRKVKVVMVGHSAQIDALLTYLANDGQVTVEGFEKIGNQVIDTTEMSVIESGTDGGLILKYRDKEFKIEKEK